MDYYSVSQVRLGDGTPAAKYAICVPSETLKRELSLADGKLKKYLPKEVQTDKHFEVKAATILGGIICASDCSLRFNQWVAAGIPEATALQTEPKNLGQPTVSMTQNEYPGVRIWLLQSKVERQPSYV